jgi:hypothetical protein
VRWLSTPTPLDMAELYDSRERALLTNEVGLLRELA